SSILGCGYSRANDYYSSEERDIEKQPSLFSRISNTFMGLRSLKSLLPRQPFNSKRQIDNFTHKDSLDSSTSTDTGFSLPKQSTLYAAIGGKEPFSNRTLSRADTGGIARWDDSFSEIGVDELKEDVAKYTEPADASGTVTNVLTTMGKIKDAISIIFTRRSRVGDHTREAKVLFVLEFLIKLPIRVYNSFITVTTALNTYVKLSGKFIATTTSSLFLRINYISLAVFGAIELGIHTYRLGKQVQFRNQFHFALIEKIDCAMGEQKPAVKQKLCEQIAKEAKNIEVSESRKNKFDQLVDRVKEGTPEDLKSLKAIVVSKDLETLRTNYLSSTLQDGSIQDMTAQNKAKKKAEKDHKNVTRLAKLVGAAAATELYKHKADLITVSESLKTGDINVIHEDNLKLGLKAINDLKEQDKKHRKLHMIGIASAITALVSTALFFVSVPTGIPIAIFVVSLVFYAAYLYYHGSLEKVGKTTATENLKFAAKQIIIDPMKNAGTTTEQTATKISEKITRTTNKFNKKLRPDHYTQLEETLRMNQLHENIRYSNYNG
ncbi:MAG: hypothetical protein AAF443_06080, partial [Chlamydiota bacterium]